MILYKDGCPRASVKEGDMKRAISGRTAIALILLALSAFPPLLWSQSIASAAEVAIIKGIAGGTADTLTGRALTALGLNVENYNSAYEKDVTKQLKIIISELSQINSDLLSIRATIQNQTCVDSLTSNQFSGAVNDIQNADSAYLSLLNNATNPDYTITQEDIDNVISKMGNLQSDLNTINTQMQLAGIDGIIGQCSLAVYDGIDNGEGGTGLPMGSHLGTDTLFYSDVMRLMNYFANIQTEGTLLLVEYDNYQAFKNSIYYSSSGAMAEDSLTAANAKAVCITPSSAMTAAQTNFCIDANDQLQQLFAYLQNQFTASGVPYTTYDSNGNMITGVWAGAPTTDPTQQKFYLFVTSLEDFTKAEDPDSGCAFPLQSTSATSPCGITASDTPGQDPYGSNLSPYGFVNGWKPATAAMWSTVMTGFDNLGSNNSETAGTWLQNAGFLDMATDTGTNTGVSKIIETPDYFEADPEEYTAHPLGGLASPQGAVCFLDTSLARANGKDPVCFNGSNGGSKAYGGGGALLHHTSTFYVTSEPQSCTAFSAGNDLLNETGDQSFYQGTVRSRYYYYDKQYIKSTYCPGPKAGDPAYWYNNILPGWAWDGGSTATNHKAFFWPVVDVSDASIKCGGTNYAWGTQSAIEREGVNVWDVPTMCNADFDRYFAANVDPVNSFDRVAFLNSPESGSGETTATLGPFTIQMQSTTYGDETPKPLTLSTDTVVTLSSTSADGVFSLSYGGPAVLSVTIPAGKSEATFYYGDPDAGTPVISASTGAINSAFQSEDILSSFPTPATVGRVDYGKPGHDNGSLRFRSRLQLPEGVKLNQAVLTIGHMLYNNTLGGGLIQGYGSTLLSFPLTLTPAKGSTPTHAIFETRPGVKPFLSVEITARARGRNIYRNSDPGMSEFDITLLHANIRAPKACADSRQVTLRTKLTVADGTQAPASFDSQIDWQCEAHGLITPTDSAR